MVIIKRYPNRKLYDTEAKQYITLDGIAQLIRQGDEIQVIDHASGEDLTALTLTQIILEHEKKRSGLLSNSLLTSLIRTGGDRLSAIQRGLYSSIYLLQQIDEEIKNRVQALVHQGDLTPLEGKNLVEKLIRSGMRRREERPEDLLQQMNDRELENLFQKYQIPSQDDLRQLSDQLEELALKLEEVTGDQTSTRL
jgi:polyhydroxyalkanoate synthesis repressor PhaR